MEKEMEAAAVLPDAKKKRSETTYVLVCKAEDENIALLEAESLEKVKKMSNSLRAGLVLVEVLRVTGRLQPKMKTVVHF